MPFREWQQRGVPSCPLWQLSTSFLNPGFASGLINLSSFQLLHFLGLFFLSCMLFNTYQAFLKPSWGCLELVILQRSGTLEMQLRKRTNEWMLKISWISYIIVIKCVINYNWNKFVVLTEVFLWIILVRLLGTWAFHHTISS